MRLIISILSSSLRSSVPLILAATGGTFSSRSGVSDLGLEGMMLFGAFFGVYGSYISGSAWVGMLFGAAFGAIASMLHAVMHITYRVNASISGMCVNLLATFAVSGLWHGTGLTYFVWGLLHGAYQCAETLLPRRKGPGKSRAADVLGWAVTFLLVQLAWVFFRAQSVSDALYLLAAQFRSISLTGLFDAVFAAYNESFQTALLVYAALAFTLAACAACILCDCWRRFKAPGGDLAGAAMALPRVRRWVLYYLLAGMVFAGYLLNNGYFATAANTLYQNF